MVSPGASLRTREPPESQAIPWPRARRAARVWARVVPPVWVREPLRLLELLWLQELRGSLATQAWGGPWRSDVARLEAWARAVRPVSGQEPLSARDLLRVLRAVPLRPLCRIRAGSREARSGRLPCPRRARPSNCRP